MCIRDREYTGRVIADEGKSVTAMDDFLYVNDKPVEETYISKAKSAYLATVSPGNFFTDDFSIGTLTDNKQTKIKKGQYLVLNDNRRDTEDSRKFGLIEKAVSYTHLWKWQKFAKKSLKIKRSS